ncbi:hypothetical protein [Pseudoduganella chitinolytica]|uniref:DUF4175 domain-containing protein n=1 Tax=Pseudoduganella chitinolytica TaxID=34070 RepID=A0ABY8B7W7_9BURK|nr:hypothetical protein [Pseudoduganella chitinolytica]WEF31128.1 hypothetical protein PX653_16820 [Pseudoduganella chitinolytica]
MTAASVLGRLLLTALLLFLILVVGFYSLYAGLFALDGSSGWLALGCVAVGAGLAWLMGWWIARLWRRKERR